MDVWPSKIRFDNEFQPTQPPVSELDMQLADRLVGLGISSLRASLIDLERQLSAAQWTLNDKGGKDVTDLMGQTPLVAATTVFASSDAPAAAEVSVQTLNPLNWQFAWRIDERFVALAQARYRLPRTEPGADHAEKVRELFESGISVETALRQASTKVEVSNLSPAVTPSPVRSVGPSNASSWAARSGRAGASTLLVVLLCLGTALGTAWAYRQTILMRDDMARSSAAVLAALQKRLAEKLVQGDYGEVQAELDAFAAFESFDAAVVTNAQSRAVASVGKIPAIRIGDAVPIETPNQAEALSIGVTDAAGNARLLIWQSPGARQRLLERQHIALLATLLMSSMAALGVSWLHVHLRNQRRAND